MPWKYIEPLDAATLPKLLAAFKRIFTWLESEVRCYEQVPKLPYGTTVRPSGKYSQTQVIVATNATAFAIANPSHPREGIEITLDLFNNTAGALGAVTFGTEYQLAGAFVAPLAGKRRLYSFYRTGIADSPTHKWRETGRSPADI